MKQFFLLGASTVYGVGGANGGWGELLKQYVHQGMYTPDGEGERNEVFNFAKSGATVRFVLDTFPQQLKHYGRDWTKIVVVSVGGNNSKAVGTPDNFVSTVEEYAAEMTELLGFLKSNVDTVFVANAGYVDESKTSPKISPLNGEKSYFTNDRRIEFRTALQAICDAQAIKMVEVPVGIEEWQQNYLYQDGLHPNDAGHQLIFATIREALGL